MRRDRYIESPSVTASGLKAAIWAVVLIGALAQSSFAKDSHVHGTAKPTSSTARESASTKHVNGKGAYGEGAKTTNAKGANSVDPAAKESIDVGEAAAPPRPGASPDKTRDANTGLKMTVPKNLPVRRVFVPLPSNPVARNAIGLPVAHDNRMGEAERARAAASTAAAPVRGIANPVNSAGGPGGPAIGRASPRPMVGASNPSLSTINGANLIRPAVTVSSLGGPAKGTTGIDGTAWRPKH
jgi:hypothetical protein